MKTVSEHIHYFGYIQTKWYNLLGISERIRHKQETGQYTKMAGLDPGDKLWIGGIELVSISPVNIKYTITLLS